MKIKKIVPMNRDATGYKFVILSLKKFVILSHLAKNLVFILIFAVSLSQAATTGTAGATFLKLNISARPQALSESFSALANDVSAIEFNPAGLIRLNKTEIGLTQVNWYNDITIQNISFGKSFSNRHAIGFSCVLLQTEDYIRTLSETDTASEIVTGDKIILNDSALSLCYAYNFKEQYYLSPVQENANLGITVKYISEKLYKTENSAVAGDIGLLFGPDRGNNYYAVAVQNIGSNIGTDILPTTVRLGTAYNGGNHTISTEVFQRIDSPWRINLGIEATIVTGFLLRLGSFYQSGKFNFNAGLGLDTNPQSVLPAKAGISLCIDYAYTPHEYLNTMHRFSLTVKF